ncbi:MAG: hypothetical protein KA165_02910 [Saprospiraceae bacterium]|nr:hypothetical protein [Saprospiraceae bacterium]
MNTLSETWFIEGNIDFESKKYTLLAYLQKISNFFGEKKLYPQLSEVIFHYNNLMTFKQNKRLLQSRFPRRLTGIQLQRLKMLYEEMIADDELMSEIEQITLFATRKMKDTIAGGTDLYDYVENNLNITPVGILPLELDEGYFFLCDGYFSSIRVYQYRLSIIERSDDKYRTLRSQHISDWERNFTNTYESIKADLMRQNRDLSTPAVYTIETKLAYPVEETLLPIAKRSLVRYIETTRM